MHYIKVKKLIKKNPNLKIPNPKGGIHCHSDERHALTKACADEGSEGRNPGSVVQ
jgi:hypothetical protein